MAVTLKLSPTQKRILALLSDGHPHTRGALRRCLYDELGAVSNVRYHVCMLRKLLAPLGQTIVCELHRNTIKYRHVRLITAPNTHV